MARQPAAVASATATHAAFVALVVGLLASSGAAYLGWLISAALTKELSAMAAEARTLTRADCMGSISVRGGSVEVVQLSHSLRQLIRRLLRSKAELEERVRLRTQELSAANSALERLATTDMLTGVLNRRGLDQVLSQVVASARRRSAPLMVMAFDADHFKRVNDTFGHDTGDLVLQAIATVLKSCTREADIVARIGGEEFVLLLPDTGEQGAEVVARDILDTIRRMPIPKVGRVTLSCGISALGSREESIGDALCRADEALYAAKKAGRDRYCVNFGQVILAARALPAATA